MSIPKTVVERVATFRNYIDTYKETSYKETSLCTDFIDPLFEALGWDISNKDGKPERYRDVEQQYSQRMQGSGTKKPDYLFRIGGAPAFFLETKKPSVNILDDKDSAYQLRRYGWNNDTIYVSILSNFEYLSLYDVRVQPKDKSDRPHVGLLRKYHFEDYIKKWDEIEGYLGRENVARGSLDKLLDDYQHLVKGKREPVDETLLKMIEGWREKLATNIALRNNNLDIHLLNSVVQRTIDRILFLRIAEDRGIENRKEFKLDEAMKGKNVYSKLIAIYDHADTKYNSGLFHFKKGADNYSKNINIDDTVLKEIIDNLYPPYYNFDFSILPVDILGHVYEKFLGRVITLDDSHQATIKEKPEVRKAGGVYYTPKYIVDYIVNNTVGKLLEGKTPKQASKLKILDPACGSGSFLLGAFQHLIDWHVEWYANNEPEKYAKIKNPPIYEIKGGWRLSTEKKKEILLNNIYGVDIDTQAVEVAKLTLLLKVLEEENNPDLGMKRALPDLGNNIKCGNSLIESDFYDLNPDKRNDLDHLRKINAFDWDKEFPKIIKWKNSRHSKLDLESPSRELEKGYGFDAVIGNPPYGALLTIEEKNYHKKTYTTSNTDSAALFIQKQYNILKKNSYGGFIVPKPMTYSSKWVGIQKLLQGDLSKIVDVSKVWKEVKLEQVIYIFQKGTSNPCYESYIRVDNRIEFVGNIDKEKVDKFGFILNGVGDHEISLAERLSSNQIFLDSFVLNRRGAMLQKYLDDSGSLVVFGGRNIKRYGVSYNKSLRISKKYTDIEQAFISKDSILAQNIVAHIMNPIDHIKIIATVPKDRNIIILDTINQLTNTSDFDCEYILGILCSKLINWYVYRFIFAKAIRTMHFDGPVTSKIPYPRLDLKNRDEKKKHDKMVQLVETMLELNKQLAETKTSHEKDLLNRQIEMTDKMIDDLVYELYELTPEEIQIVEDSLKQ